MKIKFTKKFIVIVIVIVIVLGIAVYQLFIKNNKEEFSLEKVARGIVVKEVSETGTVKASEETELSFKYGGRLQIIYVEVGDTVTIGQTLAQLDISELSIELTEAKANLGIAQAKKADAEVSLKNAYQNVFDVKAESEEDLKNAYQDGLTVLDDAYLKIYNAYNMVDNLQRDYFTGNDQESNNVKTKKNKIKNVLDTIKPYIDDAQDGSNQDIDTALSETKNGLSDVKNALEVIRNMTKTVDYRDTVPDAQKTSLDNHKSYINDEYTDVINAQQTISTTKVTNELNINSAKADISTLENQLEQEGLYQAQIDQAQANVSLLENKIYEATLRSPSGGQITKIESRPGETVQNNETVISFLPSAPFKIEVDIYEEDIVNVEVGNSVKIDLVAFPGETLKGKVVSIDPAEELIEGVVYYEVNITFEELRKGIKIGMTADIIIETNRRDDVLIVPEEALEEINGKTIVEVFDGKEIKEREIKIGLEGRDYVEVISGLEEKEQVVIR